MNTSESTTVPEYDAVIVGAGVAGLYQLYRLREMGLKVKVIEAGSEVGGTWYWNCYPGARLDSPSHVYTYWFSEQLYKDWDWSERFPTQPELKDYYNFVADQCDLRKDIQFNTRVDSAKYDEEAKRWSVTTDNGETMTGQFFITCTGMLSAPVMSNFPGESKFKGQIHHTARWPKEPVDFTGKRVGVIGTGATGMQVIQTIAPQVGHLSVFMRTPQYAIPMRNPKLTDEDRDDFKKRFHELRERVQNTFVGFDVDFDNGEWLELAPEKRLEVLEKLWEDGSLVFWIGGFSEIFYDPEINEEVSKFVRDKIRQRIDDPEMARKLIPTSSHYGFGLHRTPLETNYFEAYNQDNVDLIYVKDNPIEDITETGVRTADGKVHEVDILILATGFDAGTGSLTRIDIRGRDDRSLKEEWGKDLRTTFGLQVHGYPNMFTTGAPLAPSAALCNMTTCLQQQVDWITDCIEFVKNKEKSEVEATKEKQDEWVEHHDSLANATLLVTTNSWYNGANVKGKPRRFLSYTGGVGTYRQHCDNAAKNGYQGFTFS